MGKLSSFNWLFLDSDLKLENILLEKTDEEEEKYQKVTYENLKICDFGSSRKIDRDKPFAPINIEKELA